MARADAIRSPFSWRRALPHPLARACGQLLGHCAFLAHPGQRQRAAAQLSRFFPTASHAELRSWSRHSFAQAGAAAVDRWLLRRMDAVEICRRSTLEDWPNLASAETAGRGVLCGAVRGFGLGEVALLPLCLYRPEFSLLASERERTPTLLEDHGMRSLPATSTQGLLSGLASGGVFGFFCDDLLLAPTNTALPLTLARESGAPVVLLVALAAPQGTYQIRISPPMASAEQDLEAQVRAFWQAQIRQHPAQWAWGRAAGIQPGSWHRALTASS